MTSCGECIVANFWSSRQAIVAKNCEPFVSTVDQLKSVAESKGCPPRKDTPLNWNYIEEIKNEFGSDQFSIQLITQSSSRPFQRGRSPLYHM